MNLNDKQVNGTKTSATVALRVKPETKEKIDREVSRINHERQYGRKITTDDYVALAIRLVGSKHLEELKAAVMTNSDRMELEYLEYTKQHGSISKNDYYGLLLQGWKSSSRNGNQNPATAKQP